MLIQLPLEVWMEILDWLRGHRRELAEMCNQLGDRTFVEICQHWLHDYTKNVQLGILHIEVEKIINKGRPEKRGCLKVDIDFEQFKVPFAQVPMPANITGFLALEISYLDSMVLDFLRLMPFWTNYNSKIRLNIELWDDENEWMLRTALGHFQRLLTVSSGIKAVLFNERTTLIFPSILQQFPDLLFSAKLLVLDQRINKYFDRDRQLVRWLGTERADGKPRMAVLYNTSTSVTADLIHDIREQFPNDTAPISFFVALYSYSQLDGIPEESSNENVTTGEQLIVRKRECLHNLHDLLIGRCPVNLNGNRWLQEMEQKAAMPEECFGSWIAIYEYDSPPTMLVTLNPLLIGPIQSEVEEDRNDDNNPQDQQPGPSGLT